MNTTQISIISTGPSTRSFFRTSDLHLFKVIDVVKLTYASMKSVALKLHSKRGYECNQSAYLHSGAHQVFLQFWQLMARPVTYN